MKVLCINDQPKTKPNAPWLIRFGKDYDVMNEYYDSEHPEWGAFYELIIQPGVAYAHDYFAILPDATADEMQEQEHESIIM